MVGRGAADPSQTIPRPSRADPGRVGPSWANPSGSTEPSQAWPCQAKLEQSWPNPSRARTGTVVSSNLFASVDLVVFRARNPETDVSRACWAGPSRAETERNWPKPSPLRSNGFVRFRTNSFLSMISKKMLAQRHINIYIYIYMEYSVLFQTRKHP